MQDTATRALHISPPGLATTQQIFQFSERGVSGTERQSDFPNGTQLTGVRARV